MPDQQKKPRVRAVPVSSARATSKLNVRLTREETARLNRIVESHAARMLAEIENMQRMLEELGGASVDDASPSLGGRRGNGLAGREAGDLRGSLLGPAERFGTPHAELIGRLPRTSDGTAAGNAGPSERGGTRNDAGAFMPSGNPASWMSGAASSATVTKDPATGIVEKSWTTQNSDGTTTVNTSSHNPRTGADTTTSTVRDGNRVVNFIRITDNRDGSSEGEWRVSDAQGSTTHTWSRDASGRLVVDYFQTTDSRGRTVEEWDRAANPPPALARLPTDDETSALARRLAARFSHGRGAPPPEITKVNPGEPDDSGPTAPRINPGNSIVTNPARDNAGGGRAVSAELAKHWRTQLRDRVGGLVNPPGPGTGPKPGKD